MGSDSWYGIGLSGHFSFVRFAASLYLDYNNCIYLDSAGLARSSLEYDYFSFRRVVGQRPRIMGSVVTRLLRLASLLYRNSFLVRLQNPAHV